MSRAENRRRSPSRAALERDAALARVSRTRRWLIVGAGTLSAGVAALVSAITPGHTLGSARAATLSASASQSRASQSSAPSSPTAMPPLASAGDLGLQGPASNPQAASDPSQSSSGDQSAPAVQTPAPAAPVAPAPVVSGGS